MESKKVREIVERNTQRTDIKEYIYREMDNVDLYEFRFIEDRVIWVEEMNDIKYALDESTEIEPLACMGVTSTEEGFPLLRIELWKPQE